MRAFNLLAASLPLFAFAEEQLPFDAPQEMEEMAPMQEKIETLTSSATEIDAPFVAEYQALPVEQEQQEVASPEIMEAPIMPSVSKEEISSAMDTAIPEKVSLTLTAKEQPKQEVIAPAKPTARAPAASTSLQINLREVFAGAPLIYMALGWGF